MAEQGNHPIDTSKIKAILQRRKKKMKRLLSHCVHCSLCAESCFLFMAHKGDPQYMPSYKVINSLGKLYKKRGNVDRKTLEEMKGIVWRNCVLCRRCYCPVGIDVPSMITLARSICRSQGVYPQAEGVAEESWL
jgi:Fe-S oxidoreductase